VKHVVVIVSAVLAVIVGYYLTRETADLRFVLSERIPVDFAGVESQSNVQQLEIRNTGNAVAESIQIKIRGHITQYTVFKYSMADSIREFKMPDHLELIYPTLPPLDLSKTHSLLATDVEFFASGTLSLGLCCTSPSLVSHFVLLMHEP